MSAPIVALDPVAGCEIEDVRYLDAIEEVQLVLDEAERLFQSGARLRGLYLLVKVAGKLEALS